LADRRLKSKPKVRQHESASDSTAPDPGAQESGAESSAVAVHRRGGAAVSGPAQNQTRPANAHAHLPVIDGFTFATEPV